MPYSFLDQISVFETFRAYGGRIFELDRHWERLSESAAGLARRLPLSRARLNAWVAAALKESGLKHALCRFSVHWSGHCSALIFIAREFRSHPSEIYEKGVWLKTAVSRRRTLKAEDPQIKASQFVSGVLAHLDPKGSKIHELLFLGQDGMAAEGTVSNVFIVKGKSLLTPAVSSGILRGVTREVVIDLAREAGLAVSETSLTRHEIYSADECFITNTSSEVLPAVNVDGRRIGRGAPGPWTRRLHKEFKKRTKEEPKK